ncbi:MAG: dCTP deaminase [Magnetococcales bacterium]|nr:dCTP deaminase [Magnetococcales bacterium]MBF0602971.1 dCTP deaminase [Magnetococcales bacterium]HAT50184.1 dCTP deaminase [Alphaproteobacteria bacterium]
MRLSDQDIELAIQQGRITIDPMPPEACFGSFSVDVSLSNVFQTFRHVKIPFLNLSDQESLYGVTEECMEKLTIADHEQFFLHPGEFALGMTRERIQIADDLVGWLDGRSSLARVGLMVHITAHSIDPGWDGHITFEFFNAGRLPLALNPGLRIGAISFETLSTKTTRPYGAKKGAKYFRQKSPLPSRIQQELKGSPLKSEK